MVVNGEANVNDAADVDDGAGMIDSVAAEDPVGATIDDEGGSICDGTLPPRVCLSSRAMLYLAIVSQRSVC